MIVAFFGYAGAGKSTAARMLVERGWARRAFADPLKKMLLALGLTETQVYTAAGKQEEPWLLGGKTVRQAMQTLGTEWGRERVHPDLWLRAWEVSLPEDPQAHVVVDDLRFPNEAEALRQKGAVLIRVDREGAGLPVAQEPCPGCGGQGQVMSMMWSKMTCPTCKGNKVIDVVHPSEAHVETITPDIVIGNNGSIAALHSQVLQSVSVEGLE